MFELVKVFVCGIVVFGYFMWGDLDGCEYWILVVWGIVVVSGNDCL